MARVRLLTQEELPEPDKDVLERPINLYRVLAHTPELARRYRALGRWFRFESALEPRLRELVILQIGAVTHNAYEASHHAHLGLEFGLSEQDVRDIIAETNDEPNGLGEQERALLRAARELTLQARLSDESWAELGRWMSDAERLEVSALIAYYNMTIRILAAAEIDVEDNYLEYLEQFPGLV